MRQRINNSNGFTLIEVLIAAGLLAVVLGLVFGPLYESLGFTRQAQIRIRAQDNARLAMSRISKDLSDAVYVYDNTEYGIYFPMVNKAGDAAWVDASNNPVQVKYAKIDLVLPRKHWFCTNENHPAGRPREFAEDFHTSATLNGDVNRIPDQLTEAAPLCPESDHSRLVLKPVQPLAPSARIVRYFIGLQDPEAPYVNPYAPSKMQPVTFTDYGGRSKTVRRNMYVLYRAEFNPADPDLFPQKDADGNPISAAANLSDANFFYSSNLNASGEPYWKAWKRISREMVTEGDTDLIRVSYEDNGEPVIIPTVQFSPTKIYNDPLVAVTDSKKDPEHPDNPPTAYKATYGQWVLPYTVNLHRTQGTAVDYTTAASAGDMCIFKLEDGQPSGNAIFDITAYEKSRASSPYGWGTIPDQPELAFTVDTYKGMVNFAFPHIDPTLSSSVAVSDSLGAASAVSFSVPTSTINAYFNATASLPEYHQRMVAFNFDPSAITTSDYVIPTAGNWTPYLGNSTAVAGMEQVVGPNTNNGQFYGKPQLYTRFPFYNMFSDAAINQYKIDVGSPLRNDISLGDSSTSVAGSASLVFYSGTDSRLPEASDLSGTTGTISDIYVLYYEQNNKQGDRLSADYTTKSLITVTVGVRIYDSGSGKPVLMQLTDKIKLRNVSA